MNRFVIGFGSNIDPDYNIEKARELLGAAYTVVKESAFIKTKPVGITDQPDFINGAVLIETEHNVEQLAAELKRIEDTLGRDRTAKKFGPRTIDLDILVFNEEIIDQDFYERDFLKDSVLQLIPNLTH